MILVYFYWLVLNVSNAGDYYKQAYSAIESLQSNVNYNFASYKLKNIINSLNRCRIFNLIEEINKAKDRLMEIDSVFAYEYITLLENSITIDTLTYESVTDVGKSNYAFAVREYDNLLLDMFERYEV